MCFEITGLLEVSETFNKRAEKWLLGASSSLGFHKRIIDLNALALEIAEHLFPRRERSLGAIGWRIRSINFLIQKQI